MNAPYNAYFQTQVTTTSQADVLLMLFDAGIKFLNKAKDAMAVRDVARKGILLGKAQDIINELQSSLNKEKGGELAENLKNLYILCTSRLLLANVRMDPKIVDEVIDMLSGVREAFAEVKAMGAPVPDAPGSEGERGRASGGLNQKAAATGLVGVAQAQYRERNTPKPKPAAAPRANAGTAAAAAQAAQAPAGAGTPNQVHHKLRRATAAYGSSQG